MIQWFLSMSLLGFSAHSAPSNTCDVFRSEAFRDQHFETRISNCEKLIQSGDVPNAQALNYTLNYLAQNYKRLKDPQCAMEGLDKDFACAICKNPNRIRQGIQNGCSFVLNDLKKPWGDGTTRTTGYYVDLCQDAAGPAVEKFYLNVGTGPYHSIRPAHGIKRKESDCEIAARKNKFLDCTGARTTLVGAYLTDDKISSFHPYNPDRGPYKKIVSPQCQTMKLKEIKVLEKGEDDKCILPAIRLVGLNASNNSSEDSKPMHVSPYKSSSGCPSVGPQTTPIMKKLVQNGPALIMNYHSAQYEQRASCDNDSTSSGGASGSSGVGVSSGKPGEGVQ